MQEIMENKTTVDQEQTQPMISMRMGRTTYRIGVYFNENAKETLESKMKKIIRKDAARNNF